MPSIYKGCQKARFPSSSVPTAKGNAYIDRYLSDKVYGSKCFTGYKRFLKHTSCVLSLQVFRTLYTQTPGFICAASTSFSLMLKQQFIIQSAYPSH